METARFRVALTRSQDTKCRVERTVRRSEPDRAVFYASCWLLRTQRLEHYFGVTYDMYEIYKLNNQGEWENIDTGGVLHAETQRAKFQGAAQEDKASAKSQTRSASKRRARPARGTERDDPLIVTDKVLGAPRFKRRGQARSPLQQRLNAEMNLIRQRLAERKAKGEG